MKNTLKGAALITGASSGIGSVYADRLARRGYDLILVARNADKLNAVSRRVGATTGRIVETIPADLTDPEGLAKIEKILGSDERISMLVNNAGLGAVTTILETGTDVIDEMIGLNVTAVTRLTHAVAPTLAARGGGTIINISSALALFPELLNGVYGATKAYVLAFTLSLHKELSDKNIAIQAVLPGAIATDFWSAAGGDLSRLPGDRVMRVEDLVDAALIGLDQSELVTIPSLPDRSDWDVYEAQRQKLIPNLSQSVPAPRYRVAAAA
jgi:short-subunit dehydrogenase